MQFPRVRFTTRRLMAASAAVAGVMGVGGLNEFEASLLSAMCSFVVPPILVVMILRGFDPTPPRRHEDFPDANDAEPHGVGEVEGSR